MKGKIANNFLLAVCLLMSIALYAKRPPLPKQNGPPVDPGLPIDGGLSYLLIAGVAYGVYAIRKRVKD